MNKLFDLIDNHRPVSYYVAGALMVAFFGLLIVGGFYYQKAIQVSSTAETICKMIKPEMLNPGVCEKE